MRSAVGLRVGVPVEAFVWLASELLGDGSARDLKIEAAEPGLTLAASFELMESRVRAGATIFIDKLEINGDTMRIELRLEQVSMVPLDDTRTSISALLHANALDLSRPGDLIAYLPDMPKMIVGANGNRIVLDLMKIPRISGDPKIRHAVGILSSLVTVHRIETHDRHLDVNFRPLPAGLGAAADAMNRHLVAPGWRRARRYLPEGIRGELESKMRHLVERVADYS